MPAFESSFKKYVDLVENDKAPFSLFQCSTTDASIMDASDYGDSVNETTFSGSSHFDGFEATPNRPDDLGDMMFCMSNYAKDILKSLFMMRSHHMLTDVILEVENELFHAHKVVLSSASPYFKAMFTGGLKECDMNRVKLQGVNLDKLFKLFLELTYLQNLQVCPTAMARILGFIYTGKIRVTEITVCQLLPAATMFQVPNVIEACCAFLERQLDASNAIGIANFAEQHSCVALKQKANQFIERHFTQVSYLPCCIN